MKYPRLSLIIYLLLAIVASESQASSAKNMRISGYIGSHHHSFVAKTVARTAVFAVDEPADYIAITEVYPDTAEVVEYRYSVEAPGLDRFHRICKSPGFGPVTYFLKAKNSHIGEIRVTNECTNPDKNPAMISSVKGVREAEMDARIAHDSFRICGLIPPGASPDEQDRLIKLLADKLPYLPEHHIGRGFSYELRYASGSTGQVKQQIEFCRRWSQEYSLPAILGLVSWWSGTPVAESDGKGGKFGDIQYQQICYSPDVEFAENEELKNLLGSRYNTHYRLSVPNHWSNTPWLTMNSDVLNRYRYRRMDEAIALAKDVCGNDGTWIDSFYLENEPRYWDSDCVCIDPQMKDKTLWADFNPAAVAAAKKDGVELDPSDGLSKEELAWLHRNVGNYNQACVDALKNALSTYHWSSSPAIYTHVLQHGDMFPGTSIHHAGSELGHAYGARTGIEGLETQPNDIYRMREWGRWANVNREENDGRDIESHLWDLRVAYMMGADLYNSYNWQAIGPERFFDYVKEFVENFPTVVCQPAEVRSTNGNSLRIKMPMGLQAFSRVDILLDTLKHIKGYAVMNIEINGGRTYSSQRQRIDFESGKQMLAADFPSMVECPNDCRAKLSLHVEDDKGHDVSDALCLKGVPKKWIKFSLDLRAQRALSLYVIDRARAGLKGPGS